MQKSQELLDLIARELTDQARAKLEHDGVCEVVSAKVGEKFHFPVDFEDDGEPMWLERGTRLILVLRGPHELSVSHIVKKRRRVIEFFVHVPYPGAYNATAYLALPGRKNAEIVPLQTAVFISQVH